MLSNIKLTTNKFFFILYICLYICMYYLIRKELFLVLFLLSITQCQESTKTPIHESLLGVSLKGSWLRSDTAAILGVQTYSATKNATRDSNFLAFFSTASGKAEVLITQSTQSKSKASVHIQLLNKDYINDQVVELAFDIGRGYNRTLNQWKTSKFLTPAKLFRNMKQVITFDIVLNFQMKTNFKNQTQITLKSDSLNLVLSLEPANYGKSYFILFTVINCVQILLLLVSGKNQTTLANTSQWLILQSSCFLIVQTLFLIKLGIGYFDTQLSWLTVNVLTNILVMMLILRKFEVVLEKFKNKVKFILAFGFILVYFLMVYDFYAVPTFWIVQSMIFLWQIGYSIGRGGSGGVSIQLVLVVLLSRIPLLVLMKSSQNALKLRPDNMAANFIIVCMSIHLFIIALQKRFGGRFFTPKSIIPDYFNYLRQTLYGSQIAKTTCSICLNELRQKPEQKQEDSKGPVDAKKIQQLKQKRISYVCTPCNHCFHQKCLGDWLKQHLVCPLDKRGLPPMNAGDI